VRRDVGELEHALDVEPVIAQLVVLFIFIFVFIEFVELLLELVVVDLVGLIGFNGRLPIVELGAPAGQPARNARLELRLSVTTAHAGPCIGEDALEPARG
jgi:hypothetical protein